MTLSRNSGDKEGNLTEDEIQGFINSNSDSQIQRRISQSVESIKSKTRFEIKKLHFVLNLHC
jgi:hypothetical protein